ncbi:internal scaffolding protein [robinz microvirus RP_38]|nr:internal scaffolding protein [robinz microvirus RP_38]
MTRGLRVNAKTGEVVKSIDSPLITVPLHYVRHPYDYNHRVKVTFKNPSLTHQSFAESADVNYIISRFDRTGLLESSDSEQQYADVTGLQIDLTESYNDSLQKIEAVKKYDNEIKAESAKRAKAEQAEFEEYKKQKSEDKKLEEFNKKQMSIKLTEQSANAKEP